MQFLTARPVVTPVDERTPGTKYTTFVGTFLEERPTFEEMRTCRAWSRILQENFEATLERNKPIGHIGGKAQHGTAGNGNRFRHAPRIQDKRSFWARVFKKIAARPVAREAVPPTSPSATARANVAQVVSETRCTCAAISRRSRCLRKVHGSREHQKLPRQTEILEAWFSKRETRPFDREAQP